MNQPITSFVSEGNVRANSVKKSHEYKLLKENIKKIGIKTPITYRVNDKGQNVIINGHQRFEIAKSLKFEDIPAFEMNGVDDVTAQIATNLFTVPMNHMDGAKAIMDLYKSGSTPTRKDLSTMFGKNNNWINVSLAMTNTSPLLNNYIKIEREGFANGVSEELEVISRSNIDMQERTMFDMLHPKDEIELSNYKDMNQDWFNERVDNYGWGNDTFVNFVNKLANNLMDDDNRFLEICEIVGKDNFREFEKTMNVEYEYQDGLFQEYNDNQWCKDEGFLQNLFYTYTEIGTYLFNLEVETQNKDWWEVKNKVPFNFKNKLTSFKRNIASDAGVKFTQVELVAWDGSILNPFVEYRILKDNEKTKEPSKKTIKEPNYSLLYNKLNKVVAPMVNEYISENVSHFIDIKNDEDRNKTLDWLTDTIGNMTFRPGYAKKGMSNDDVITYFVKKKFQEHYKEADFIELDKLCKALGQTGLSQIVTDKWESNTEFRSKYLSCFPVAVLKEELPESKGTKSELVEELSNDPSIGQVDLQADKPLLFSYCMTNEGSGGNSLGTYLSKEEE